MKCSAVLPANAKFCPECGAKVEHANANVCAECGEALKPEAKFCSNCGAAAESHFEEPPERSTQGSEELEGAEVKRNWLATFGPLLFIPIFAGIIVLLFWKNKDSGPINASDSKTAEQSMPSAAAMEQVHKTLERLKANLQANPEDVSSMDSLAQMYYVAGSYEKASKYLERHLEIEPDNRDAKMFLATAYGHLNRTDEAVTIINEILEKEPTYAFGLYNLGLIYASQGNQNEALENWKMVVQYHPGTEVAQLAEQRIHELEHIDQAN